LMTNFTDAAHAEELANFAPAQTTSGGRIVALRAYERIMTAADFAAQQLPAVDEWVKRRMARPEAGSSAATADEKTVGRLVAGLYSLCPGSAPMPVLNGLHALLQALKRKDTI